jgi:hypothetical protein
MSLLECTRTWLVFVRTIFRLQRNVFRRCGKPKGRPDAKSQAIGKFPQNRDLFVRYKMTVLGPQQDPDALRAAGEGSLKVGRVGAVRYSVIEPGEANDLTIFQTFRVTIRRILRSTTVSDPS